MPRESTTSRRERVTRLLQRLRETYPDAHCELEFRNPLELLVATILSAQCSDRQVNRVTRELFRKYPTAAAYAAAPPGALEQDIRSIGLFRAKARNLRAAATCLVEQHGGEVPASLPDLLQLDGVGRKTANVVLGNAFGITEGIVVDTHVARLSQRLGLTRLQDPVHVERDLMKLVPRDDWTQFSHWLIWHGRRRCSALRPACHDCELLDLCPRRGITPARGSPCPPS